MIVGIATRLRAGRSRVRFLVRARDYFLRYTQTPIQLAAEFFPGGKAAEA